MNPILARLGLSPESIRRAAGVVAPPPPRRTLAPYKPRKTATHYLDGEEQREKKAKLVAEHGRIMAMIVRGVPINEIAKAYGVTNMAIYNRAKPVLRLVRNRHLEVNAQVAQHEGLVVEVDDDDAQVQAAPYEFKTGQLFLFRIDQTAPASISHAPRFRKDPDVSSRVAKKLKAGTQYLFDDVGLSEVFVGDVEDGDGGVVEKQRRRRKARR
jgi:hypothetical protein